MKWLLALDVAYSACSNCEGTSVMHISSTNVRIRMAIYRAFKFQEGRRVTSRVRLLQKNCAPLFRMERKLGFIDAEDTEKTAGNVCVCRYEMFRVC